MHITQTETGMEAFHIAAPAVWNSLSWSSLSFDSAQVVIKWFGHKWQDWFRNISNLVEPDRIRDSVRLH